MKLISQIYNSPILTEGVFTAVEINDVQLVLNSNENYLSVKFEMSHEKNGERVVLETNTLAFLGNENDKMSSNRTTVISIPNPDVEGERIVVPMFDYIAQNGMPQDYQIEDWGYPTAEKAKMMFTGGTLLNPKINLEDDFAKAWLLNTLVFKGEKVGVQFQFEV